MKNLSLLLMALICYPQLAYTQWFEQTTGITIELLSVSAVDDYNVWACGVGGTVIKTTNGGDTWIDVSGSPIPDTLTLNSISGRTESTAIVTGADNRSAYVYITYDGGSTWSQTFAVMGGYIYGTVFTAGNNFGLHCNPIGGFWKIYWSSNNGSKWQLLSTYPQEGSETGWNNALCVVYPDGWSGTNSGRLYYSPTGEEWSPQPTTRLINSKAVWFKNKDVGMAGGNVIDFTTDGGSSWTFISVPGTGDILGIAADGDKWWYVRGSSVYHSTDNGGSWSMIYTAPSGIFNHLVKATNGSHLWAVRSNGGISSTHTPVGIEDERKDAIPEIFSLAQNYPNPFNPSTTFSYTIPNASKVIIKIYDVLGNEIETLVNDDKEAGNYEVKWNAVDLPSGVYFYQLSTGSFIETKNMLLLK